MAVVVVEEAAESSDLLTVGLEDPNMRLRSPPLPERLRRLFPASLREEIEKFED
jgi:hypothetical protein